MTFQPDVYRRVLELLPPPPSRVLDLGAGQGFFCSMLLERGYQVEACDFSRENFRCEDVAFHPADFAEGIPLADAGFDCVVSIEVLEHLTNQSLFVQEALRILKPGGRLILTTPNISSLPSRVHFFLYGTTDCAPFPLDPGTESIGEQHIHPIGILQILFFLERFGAELKELHTNRLRRGAWPWMLLYPVLWLVLRLKWLRKKRQAVAGLNSRALRWMLHPANLMGRLTIAVGEKLATAPGSVP